MDIDQLRSKAEQYRALYNLGECEREEAKKYIQPYLDAVNLKSKEIAKKYNKKPHLITFSVYIR